MSNDATKADKGQKHFYDMAAWMPEYKNCVGDLTAAKATVRIDIGNDAFEDRIDKTTDVRGEFPKNVALVGVEIDALSAQASVEQDKIHILEAIGDSSKLCHRVQYSFAGPAILAAAENGRQEIEMRHKV